MKKIFKNLFGVIFAITLLATDVDAQTHYSSNVSIGVKAGADLSMVMFTPSVNQNFNFGYTGGFMFRYIEEDHFGLIAELNFIQRGWKEDFEDAPYRYSRTTNYIELPVLAHIYFGRRGRFFINLGPEIGMYLGEKVSANFNPKDMASLPDFPLKNRMNDQMVLPIKQKFDYGITGGLGAEFNINKQNSICIEGRYYFGLGNIFSSKRADTYSSSNQWSIVLTAGYWFRIK